jgi:hypothetical protein
MSTDILNQSGSLKCPETGPHPPDADADPGSYRSLRWPAFERFIIGPVAEELTDHLAARRQIRPG